MNTTPNKSSGLNAKIIPYSFILEDEEKLELLNHIRTLKFPRKSVIIKQNNKTNRILFIKSGLVKIFREDINERSIILQILKEGNFINLNSIFCERNTNQSASAISDAVICETDIDVFKKVVFRNIRYVEQLFQLLCDENLLFQERLVAQVQKKLPGKVADVLLYFSEQLYKSKKFSFPVSRKELANFAGITKESFIRTLTEFRNDKIIEIEGSKIEVINMDILKTL